MQIRHQGDVALEVVPVDADPFTAEPGEWVDVPDPVAKRLIGQGWEVKQPEKTRASKKAANRGEEG